MKFKSSIPRPSTMALTLGLHGLVMDSAHRLTEVNTLNEIELNF